MGPLARQQRTQQSTYMMCDGAALLKLENKVHYYYINIRLLHVTERRRQLRQQRINDETMGAAGGHPPVTNHTTIN